MCIIEKVMKKALLPLAALLAVAIMQAQDIVLVHPVTSVQSDFAGVGMVWDCSSASTDNEQYIYFRPHKNNPMAFSVYDGYTHYHLLQHGDTTFLTGYENHTFKVTFLSPTLRFLPLTIGDTARAEFSGEGEYCHSSSYLIAGSLSLTTDATGILKLPSGEFQVNRSHLHRDITMYGADTVNIKEDTYQWFSPVKSFPLLEQHEVREVADERDSLVLSQAFFCDLDEETVSDLNVSDSVQSGEQQIITSLSHFPNPVETIMIASYLLGIDADVYLILTSSSGLPMWSRNVEGQTAGEHTVSIDMSGYPRGTYELHVSACGQTVSETIIKI